MTALGTPSRLLGSHRDGDGCGQLVFAHQHLCRYSSDAVVMPELVAASLNFIRLPVFNSPYLSASLTCGDWVGVGRLSFDWYQKS